jgi:periplasmic divalent cation tolerance protein
MELLAVFTTVSDEKQAEMLATAAVEQCLAACVQAEPVRSVYRWHGAVQRESEIRLIFKTTLAKYHELESLLIKLHPYELPAIFAIPVSAATSAYANWVHQAVDSATGEGRA